MFIFGFKHDRAKLLEVERKAKMEERHKLDVYYQKEINKIRKEHIQILDSVHQKYADEKKEYEDCYRKQSANILNQTTQDLKNKYKKIIKNKDEEIEKLQQDIKLLRTELGTADQKIQKSQKAYRKYREYVLQTFRHASQLSDEVKEIFSISGNLFQRFSAIRDKIEYIDTTNVKYSSKLAELLDMNDSDILIHLKNLEELKEIDYKEEDK